MEDVLLSLVNSVMRNAGLPTVVKLEIRNPYVLRRWRGDKEPIVDVRATDEKGNVFDLEMQVDGHADFMKRVDYYGARLLVDQIGRGDDYGDLRRAYDERERTRRDWVANVDFFFKTNVVIRDASAFDKI